MKKESKAILLGLALGILTILVVEEPVKVGEIIKALKTKDCKKKGDLAGC